MSAGTAFTTIRTEGAILPPDILNRIAAGDKDLGGLTEAAYHLTGEKFGEATNRAWNRLQSAWLNFQTAREKLSENDTGTSVTRERWLLPLFQLLDYGQLQTAKAEEVGGKQYAISHAWQQTPIHLVGCKVELDRRIQTGTGGTRSSPHSLLQELLNRSDQHLWGMVSNGLRLRLLRDNISLTRQAYVEFDLEAMMAGEAYSDFVLLWLLLHQSRFEAERADQCQLEKWSQAARTEGVRLLDGLRDGVQRSIEHLGQGFLAHQANAALREHLRSGALDKQDYYRQILRLVYRLLFLFVADDRDLLLVPTADPEAQKRYRDFYATTRLRRLAAAGAGSRHHDLYRGLKLVMEKLSGDGCPELALPALGSFLFSPRALPDLNACDISNLHLLEAIRSLAVTQTGQSRRVVDYKNLGAEELGSVYESLLELHPDLEVESHHFLLTSSAGNERKSSSSYYTDTTLISSLLDSALNLVLRDATAKQDSETAILNVKVVDTACGSGHFLIAAAHRIAKTLAAARTGEEEPPLEIQRRALREVIGRCVYGVDLNPMAVELCKVNLWLESLEPGKPLSFLEHRIQCGNSLLGSTPRAIEEGIPDEAFSVLEGDMKEACSKWKKVNKSERAAWAKKQQWLGFDAPWNKLGNFAASLLTLDNLCDDSITDVREKERLYDEAVRSGDYLDGKFLADAWCASMVWKKDSLIEYPITEEIYRQIERNPAAFAADKRLMTERIRSLAEQYGFFHWHLAFPDVFHVISQKGAERGQTGWRGGFDAILGNPPWDKFTVAEEEWFARREPQIASTKGKARRAKLISSLAASDPALFSQWKAAQRDAGVFSLMCSRGVGRFPLTGTGELNTYHLFAELATQIVAPRGHVGLVVKTGIAAADNCLPLIKMLTDSQRLISCFDFVNTREIFKGVQTVERFSLITFSGTDIRTEEIHFATLCQAVEDLSTPGRVYTLTPDDVRRMSPLNGAIPLLKAVPDAEIMRRVYGQFPILGDHQSIADSDDRWKVEYCTIFHMANESEHFKRREELESAGLMMDERRRFVGEDEVWLPLYEGKYIYHFDHRYGSFETVPESKRYGRKATAPSPTAAQLENPAYELVPRYWFPQSIWETRRQQRTLAPDFLFLFRDVAGVYPDLRTAIGAICPSGPAGHKAPCLSLRSANVGPQHHLEASLQFASIFCSLPFDYIVRNKLYSKSLNLGTLQQIPMPRPSSAAAWPLLTSLGLELSFTSNSLNHLGTTLRSTGPFRWDSDRRFLMQREIDAIVAHLYGLTRDEVRYVLSTFGTLADYERRKYGEYKTGRIVLEIFDLITAVAASGHEYQTRLDPPPADPRVAHQRKKIGVLAFGSLIGDPGPELSPRIVMRVRTKTPFPVEYGRISSSRGGAPTLVPHDSGSPVSAEILVLDDDVSGDEARDMLWRRERRRECSGEKYVEGTAANSVLVREASDSPWVGTVLHTDFNDAGKIAKPTPADLAACAIQSVRKAEGGKDGISYLIDAMACGIQTPLTEAYRDEILKQTKTPSLHEALNQVRAL